MTVRSKYAATAVQEGLLISRHGTMKIWTPGKQDHCGIVDLLTVSKPLMKEHKVKEANMYDRYTSDRKNADITESLVSIRRLPELLRSEKDDLADACNRIHEQRKDIDRLTALLKRAAPIVTAARNALVAELNVDMNSDNPKPPEIEELTNWLVEMALATSEQTLAERYTKLRELAEEIGVSPHAS